MLTRKQYTYYRLLAKEGFNPEKKKECLLAAGYGPTMKPYQVENSTKLKRMIYYSMVRNNLTPDRLCKKLDEKLECRDPKTDAPDNANQLKAVDMSLKLGGFYPSEKIDVTKREESFHFDVRTLKLAEEVTGEKILDAEVVEEKQLESHGDTADDGL